MNYTDGSGKVRYNIQPDVISGATLTFSAGSVTEAMTEIMDTAAGK